jgi:rRNA maturation endonuclease Nob1
MSLTQRLMALATDTRYVCQFCRQSFEQQRRNCPACGCEEIART